MYEHGDSVVVFAQELAEQVSETVGLHLTTPVATFKGRDVDGIRFRHPLYDRDSIAVLADYVTLEQGTGVVHTAPGHGVDDFLTGQRYGLDTYAPVGPSGRFAEDVGLFAGLQVFRLIQRSSQPCNMLAGCCIGLISSTRTRTAGAVTVP